MQARGTYHEYAGLRLEVLQEAAHADVAVERDILHKHLLSTHAAATDREQGRSYPSSRLALQSADGCQHNINRYWRLQDRTLSGDPVACVWQHAPVPEYPNHTGHC